MELTTNYRTKAALLAALEASKPTAVWTGGNVWINGPITIEGPMEDPTWTAEAVVENGFIVRGSVK